MISALRGMFSEDISRWPTFGLRTIPHADANSDVACYEMGMV
jgi:hypothetical protein